MKDPKPLVAIVMGSDSDLSVMEETAKILSEFEVPYEITVSLGPPFARSGPRNTPARPRNGESK